MVLPFSEAIGLLRLACLPASDRRKAATLTEISTYSAFDLMHSMIASMIVSLSPVAALFWGWGWGGTYVE